MNKYLKSIISMIICQMIIYVNILLNEIIFPSDTGKNFYEWGLLLTYIFLYLIMKIIAGKKYEVVYYYYGILVYQITGDLFVSIYKIIDRDTHVPWIFGILILLLLVEIEYKPTRKILVKMKPTEWELILMIATGQFLRIFLIIFTFYGMLLQRFSMGGVEILR
ncbi:hypothetical protein [Pseudoleptotrichia goodfellowii]|uniref:Uncharacterized protein n=1 Tax=Pseudoleptotrichia goodfellowii TaxID=157692 RepID=A0A510J9M0_9FUSO|nr:hypothetical protein [Pseudoleptotrichia goodfellowii]BBM36002.1 hypothetical protein JCM16774_0934 [Pseudoleptotrichia goodfellowii]